jgi:hypothetical protein
MLLYIVYWFVHVTDDTLFMDMQGICKNKMEKQHGEHLAADTSQLMIM